MISGDGFATMHFDVDAVPADQFTTWVTAAKRSGPSLDTQTYADLTKQSMSVQPFTYRAVQPDLFLKIVTQVVPPGPGPENSPTPGVAGKALRN